MSAKSTGSKSSKKGSKKTSSSIASEISSFILEKRSSHESDLFLSQETSQYPHLCILDIPVLTEGETESVSTPSTENCLRLQPKDEIKFT